MNTASHSKGNCGTSFKSSVKLREFDNGPLIAHTKDDGQYTWPDAMAGNVIEFDVETKESDTCFAKLVTLDLEYVGRLTNTVTESLGENATPEAIMNEVMKNIDMSKMFLTIRSKSFETDSSGNYTGHFTIENTFREMPLYVMLSYGYSGKAERSDWETAWDETISEVLIIIAEEIVFALICAAIVAGSGGVASGVVAGMYAAKAAKWGKRAKDAKKAYSGAKAVRVGALADKGKDVITFTGKGAKGFGKAAFDSKAALRGATRTSARAGMYYLGAAAHMATWMGGYYLYHHAVDQMGAVDINKSGCQFPAGGYTDMYSFSVGGGDEEWLTFLSTMTPESIGYMGTGVETQAESSGIGMDSPFLIYGGITILGLLLLFMFSGDDEEGGDA